MEKRKRGKKQRVVLIRERNLLAVASLRNKLSAVSKTIASHGFPGIYSQTTLSPEGQPSIQCIAQAGNGNGKQAYAGEIWRARTRLTHSGGEGSWGSRRPRGQLDQWSASKKKQQWMRNQMTSNRDYKSCHVLCFILIIIKLIRIEIIIHGENGERKHFPGPNWLRNFSEVQWLNSEPSRNYLRRYTLHC